MLDEYSLFLGCIVPNRYPGIESATRLVFNKLGVRLVEMEGASCCPAPGVVGSLSERTWEVVAARNLSLAEKNRTDVITLCNGCFGTLFEVNSHLKQNAQAKRDVNKILTQVGRTYEGIIEVHHFAKRIFDKHLNQVDKERNMPLEGVKIAVHYGCHLLRPKNLKNVDNPERPGFVDEIVRRLGGLSIDYKDKNMCCGAGGGVRSSALDVALDITKEKLENIRNCGADCILNVCSFCHFQFDRGQKELNEKSGLDYKIPVIHLSQLLGLAFGFEPSTLGLNVQEISVEPLLKKLNR
jgi:heterodisulfide reductase subunit B